MLTDTELNHRYLSLGPGPVHAAHLAFYWSELFGRRVTIEEVWDATRRLSEKWCYDNPAECEENRQRWERIVAENAASHASGLAFWRNQTP